MRLSDEHRRIILERTAALIGPDAKVTLFGSRVDDDRRGGDVDLLVEVPRTIDSRVKAEALLAGTLEHALGGRRVDVLLVDPTTEAGPVHLAARAHGVAL